MTYHSRLFKHKINSNKGNLMWLYRTLRVCVCELQDFHGSRVKKPTYQCRGSWVRSLDWELRSHMAQGNKICVPQLWKPVLSRAASCNKRIHCNEHPNEKQPRCCDEEKPTRSNRVHAPQQRPSATPKNNNTLFLSASSMVS